MSVYKSINICGLKVSSHLYTLLLDEVLPGLELDSYDVWQQLADLAHDLAPENRRLLAKRETLQNQIDEYHLANRDISQDSDETFEAYKQFLVQIGYIEPVVDDFTIENNRVDAEINTIAGPQLVVPVNNARFALNAANARWGSLYDALYGTDAIANKVELKRSKPFNPQRGRAVIAWANEWLDVALPLVSGSHEDVLDYHISGNQLIIKTKTKAKTVEQTSLADKSQWLGYNNNVLVFRNNDLHIEIQIDRADPIGQLSAAGVKDIQIESAISTICDCEDSVAAVDGEDKAEVYRNWLGLMRGDLSVQFDKAGKIVSRSLNPDRQYQSPDGEAFGLPGRSLLLVRNVGHLMTTPAVILNDGSEIPEGILDAFMTTLIALYDLKSLSEFNNSSAGSLYIVKPKMHGSEEVAFACRLFSRVEQALGLAENTIKIGIMDEERRTTVNLKNCIHAARERLIFINTGFLDRTGDEIHTSMQAGPFMPKGQIKQQKWIHAYENWNVDIGLACGLSGKAQIGKGMWAMPDLMADMLEQKLSHLEAGANCAWVPSPTAASLHATHYHRIKVADVQQQLLSRGCASLDDILTIPLLTSAGTLSSAEIQRELDNNAQGILGYVVRWINQGVGCSKVPDIYNVGLMEDRATLRISSQLLANWLQHGLCSKMQIKATFQRMALVVDQQNEADSDYQPMAADYSGIAYQSALSLVLKGHQQPSGYTEPLLHAFRQEIKQLVREGNQAAAGQIRH